MDHASVMVTWFESRIENGSFDPFGTGGEGVPGEVVQLEDTYRINHSLEFVVNGVFATRIATLFSYHHFYVCLIVLYPAKRV